MVKQEIFYIHAVPLAGSTGREGRFNVSYAEGLKGPIASCEFSGRELAKWMYDREEPHVRTLYHHSRRWAFQGIVDGQQTRKTMVASPHICSPAEFNDKSGIAIGRMRQCALQPACGGWRRYAGVEKHFHEILIYRPEQRPYAKLNPLYPRYAFLSPQMTLEGFISFVELVGNPRWFATDICPTGATGLKEYLGLRPPTRKYPKPYTKNLAVLRSCYGNKLEPLKEGETYDLLRARLSVVNSKAAEAIVINFMIDYLMANWLHVLHAGATLGADMDFFVPEYHLSPYESELFNASINSHESTDQEG